MSCRAVEASQSVEQVVASDDVSYWLLKIEAAWAPGLPAHAVRFGALVAEDDVVFEGERAV